MLKNLKMRNNKKKEVAEKFKNKVMTSWNNNYNCKQVSKEENCKRKIDLNQITPNGRNNTLKLNFHQIVYHVEKKKYFMLLWVFLY